MASTPKGPQKIKLEYVIDRGVYDDFVRACSKGGYAPQVLIERLMKKYTETGLY